MSFAIIQTVFRKLESRFERNLLEDVNKTHEADPLRARVGFSLEVDEIAEQQRPPMLSLPEYQECHAK